MILKKVFAGLFAALGICTAAAAVYIGMNYTDRNPLLLTPPTVATQQVVTMIEAACSGDYEKVSSTILGTPSLGVDRAAADEVGVLIWDAFQDSLSIELVGECYSTAEGLAQDITVTGLDIESVAVNLRQRSQTLLERRVNEAENTSEVYDENNEYREDVVMDVLYDAVCQALEEDAVEKTVNLTLKLVYSEGKWWIVSDTALLDALSGGIMY